MFQLGKIIGGKYELIRLIGEGGMGAVYEARHVEIRQHVALKLLHHQLARDQEIRQRFFREAMSAGEIGHENIIEMHDIGRDVTGSIYLVMELLKGESLAERIRRMGALDVQASTDIMLQVLDALRASHEKGIVHRDMKPENVFLCRLGGRDDFVKILDFGIAKVKDPVDGESLTRTGTMLGTAAYMAPEQIAGDREADHRMDIYACGIILYQMLVGRVPFDATSVHGVIYKIMNEDPPPLGDLKSGLPGGLEAAVRRAISRNRDHRFQTAADFAASLVPYGSGRIVLGRSSRLPAAAPATTLAPTRPEPVVPASAPAEPVAPAAIQAEPPVAPPLVPSAPFAPAPPPREKSGVGWVLLIVIPLVLLGLLAVVVVGVVGGMAVLRGRSPDTTTVVEAADAASQPDEGAKAGGTFKVEVDTLPTGGEIYVDGTLRGTAPVTLELAEGTVAITAKKEGYPGRTTSCKVEKDITNRCVISLIEGTPDASAAGDVLEVKTIDEEEAAGEEPGAKKVTKKKCDPRVNPKCKFLGR